MTVIGRDVPGPRPDWQEAQRRFTGGESRSFIFRDLVLAEIAARRGAGPVTVLDIGCGRGFDHQPELQRDIARASDRYVGVEPDPEIPVEPVFAECHRSILEDAGIPPGSVDVAFSVMVLEHVADPDRHWGAIHSALREGGAYWGFTMDSRHWFSLASRATDRLGIKEAYLRMRFGKRGEGRYENYPTFYRANNPSQLGALRSRFRSVETASLHRVGQVDTYLPPGLRGVGRLLDSAFAARRVGLLFLVRAVK